MQTVKRKKMKLTITILLSITLISCSNFSPNKKQLQTTRSHLKCYDQLISIIKADTALQNRIIKTRNSVYDGPGENYRVVKEYRLVKIEDIDIDSSWLNNCYEKIMEDSDIRGIRFVNKNQVIIEIDKFERHALEGQYSSTYPVEFHRLIYSKNDIDRSAFYKKMEVEFWVDTIREGCIYEVSQIQ